MQMRNAVAKAAEQIDIYNWENYPEDQDVTFARWLHQRGMWNNGHIKHVAGSLVNALVEADSEDVGAHYLFDYIKSAGGLGNLTKDGVFGERTQRVRQGESDVQLIPWSRCSHLPT
jgi:monoamine oxidase